MPWRALQRLPSLRFAFDPATPILAAGDTAQVSGTVRNLLPGQPLFAYVKTVAGETRYPLAAGPDGRFAFAHGPVDSDFVLALAGENGRSADLAFRVVAPPFLARIQAILHPPGYTRLRVDTLPAGVTRFPVLPGTRSNGWPNPTVPCGARYGVSVPPMKTRRIIPVSVPAPTPARPPVPALRTIPWDRADPSASPGKSASRPIMPMVGGRRRHPFPSFDTFSIDLVPDLPPEVDLVSPATDTVLDRDGKLSLSFRAKDDFGIASFQLIWKVMATARPARKGSGTCAIG